MKSNEYDEILIRRYLLGELAGTHMEEVELRVLSDSCFATLLAICEDELIEDYAIGRLSLKSRRSFEMVFLNSDIRRRKLKLIRAMLVYVESHVPSLRSQAE